MHRVAGASFSGGSANFRFTLLYENLQSCQGATRYRFTPKDFLKRESHFYRFRFTALRINTQIFQRDGVGASERPTSPPMPQKPSGKGGWDTTTPTRQSAREDLEAHSSGSRGQTRNPVPVNYDARYGNN